MTMSNQKYWIWVKLCLTQQFIFIYCALSALCWLHMSWTTSLCPELLLLILLLPLPLLLAKLFTVLQSLWGPTCAFQETVKQKIIQCIPEELRSVWDDHTGTSCSRSCCCVSCSRNHPSLRVHLGDDTDALVSRISSKQEQWSLKSGGPTVFIEVPVHTLHVLVIL